MIGTRNWQRGEGLLAFIAGLILVAQTHHGLSPWLMVLLFFAPDLSFAAYAIHPRFGSAVYNLLHLYGFGLLVAATGVVLAHPFVAATGFLWLAHAGFDRALGYGLKEDGAFDRTHLGPIGKAKNIPE